MAELDFIYDEQGVRTPRFIQARALAEQIWRGYFGEGAQTASDSPDGNIIDTAALLFTLLWQGVQTASANSFFRTASGAALDLLLDMFARYRLDPSPTRGSVFFFGEEAATLDPDSECQAGLDGVTFTVDEGQSVTFPASNVATTIAVHVTSVPDEGVDVEVVLSVGASAKYTVQAGDSELEVAAGLAAEASLLWVADAVSDAYELVDGSAVFIARGLAYPALVTSEDHLAVYAAEEVTVTATVTGANEAFAGSINRLPASIAGVVGVINVEDATIGRARESPDEFRARHHRLIKTNAVDSWGRIVAAVERAVAGTENTGDLIAMVFENDTDEYDGDRPPHSFETYVLYDDAIPGIVDRISEAIRSTKPPGIRAYGTIERWVPDSQGILKRIGHTPAVERYVHMRISLTPGEGWSDELDNETAIRQGIASRLQPGGLYQLRMGSDVTRIRIARIVDELGLGVAEVDVELAATDAPEDSPSFASADIEIPQYVIARVDTTRIEFV